MTRHHSNSDRPSSSGISVPGALISILSLGIIDIDD